MAFESYLFDAELRLPLGGVVETLIAKTPINSIEVGICEKSWDYQTPREGERFGPNLLDIYTKIITPFFVEFFEDYRSWLDANVSMDFTKWPNVWQFARIVRNAASHNAISINDPNFKPVSWYAHTYGSAQHGRAIFGSDLPLADILILMLEMNDSLDALGCPS